MAEKAIEKEILVSGQRWPVAQEHVPYGLEGTLYPSEWAEPVLAHSIRSLAHAILVLDDILQRRVLRHGLPFDHILVAELREQYGGVSGPVVVIIDVDITIGCLSDIWV